MLDRSTHTHTHTYKHTNTHTNTHMHTQGGVTFSSKKKRWMVLYKESIAGPSRLELYRKEDDATAPPMVIELNTVTSVVAVEGKMEFMISFTDSQVTFACKANADVQDWVSDINRCRGVDFDTTHTSASNGSALYDAIPGDEVFAVRLRKSQSLTFQGACILEIEKIFDRSQFHISLFTEQSPRRLIVKWQIDHIRQYGSNETAFKFHSGSKSSTGVDWFVMDTEPGVAGRIHRAVDYWAKYIVEQIRNNQSQGQVTPVSPGSRINATVTNSPKTPRTTPANDAPQSVYTQLDIRTRHEHNTYDTVGIEAAVHRPSMHQNPANPSQGQYQAIQLTNGASSPPPQSSSEYSSLNPSSREREAAAPPPVIPPRASTTPRTQDQYMQLTPDTRRHNNGTRDQYMELSSETRDQVEPSYTGIERK
ncbi:hypothetical protein EMCRGX_G031895 [Ephydatia muelleri]